MSRGNWRRARRIWLGSTLALAVAACVTSTASDVTWKPSDNVAACTLAPVEGMLVDIDGRTAITGATFHSNPLPDPLFVRWPDGWQVRIVLGGLEVLDATGTIQARTGNHVAVGAAAGAAYSPGSPVIVDGALLACPFDDPVSA